MIRPFPGSAEPFRSQASSFPPWHPLSLWTRRGLIRANLLVISEWITRRLLGGEFPAELAPYDLYLPPSHYQEFTRRFIYDPRQLAQIVKRLYEAYESSKDPRFAEAVFFYTYAWWRATPTREERERIALWLNEVGKKVEAHHRQSPLGFIFQAAATGMIVVSTGILNALNLVPRYRQMLEQAIALNSDYFYGLLYILMAALYLKVPPFPVAVGDMGKARKYLEQAAPLARRKYGFWYIFYGEYLLLTEGPQALEKLSGELIREVNPPNAYLAYIRDSAISDLRFLLEKFQNKAYDKYLYTPLLEVAKPSGLYP